MARRIARSDELLTLAHAAKRAGVAKMTAHLMCKRGELEPVMVAGVRYLTRGDVFRIKSLVRLRGMRVRNLRRCSTRRQSTQN